MSEKLTYEDFLKGLNPFEESFVAAMHAYLIQKGYSTEVKPAAQGPVVSYQTPKPKRTVFNYVFRKSGMQVRIYGDNAREYQDFLQTFPAEMTKAMDKAANCRQCNSRCPKGYSVSLNGNMFEKCRYGAFLFSLIPETMPYIKAFIEHEVEARESK